MCVYHSSRLDCVVEDGEEGVGGLLVPLSFPASQHTSTPLPHTPIRANEGDRRIISSLNEITAPSAAYLG